MVSLITGKEGSPVSPAASPACSSYIHSPSHPFLILFQVSVLEVIIKEKTYWWNSYVVHAGREVHREFDMYQVSFLLNDTLNMPRDVSDCSGACIPGFVRA